MHVPEIVFNDNNEKIIQTSKDLKTRYLREQINSELIIESKLFPNQDTTRIKEFELFDSNGVKIENLVVYYDVQTHAGTSQYFYYYIGK